MEAQRLLSADISPGASSPSLSDGPKSQIALTVFALTAIAHADSTRIARNFEPWNSRVLPYVVSSRKRAESSCAIGRWSYHDQMSLPRGVFCLLPSAKSGDSRCFDNADVDGISIRQSWEQMNPADGTYDWTYLDSQIDRA